MRWRKVPRIGPRRRLSSGTNSRRVQRPRPDRRRHGRAQRHGRGSTRRAQPRRATCRAGGACGAGHDHEDDVLLREGLASLLDRSGFEVVGQAGDGGQLLALVRDTTPDLVRDRDSDAADLQPPRARPHSRVIRELPDTGILVLSAHVDVEHAMELLAGGRGIGYLLKSRITDVVTSSTRYQRSPRGHRSWTPHWCPELVSARRRDDPLAALTEARARGTGVDGRGTFQRRYRSSALGHGGHRREACPQHSHQVEPAGDRAITAACWRSSPSLRRADRTR